MAVNPRHTPRPASTGTVARHGPESWPGILRNWWPASTGIRKLQPEAISDPALIAATQATSECDEVLFPINKKSTQKEPRTWSTELAAQGISPTLLRGLAMTAQDALSATLRAKKAVACLLFISNRPMAELEDILTQYGGTFGGAAGPIRSIAARTSDMIPIAARVAELLHPNLDLAMRVGRLVVRLTYGVPSGAVDLARELGADFLRGDYCALAKANLCTPEQLTAVEDKTLSMILEGNVKKVTLLRLASDRIAARLKEATKIRPPALEKYEP